MERLGGGTVVIERAACDRSVCVKDQTARESVHVETIENGCAARPKASLLLDLPSDEVEQSQRRKT